MDTAKVKNVNVYDKISRGEYICRGNRLYSREEMEKMLVDSGLSPEEIEVIYNLNAKAATSEVQKIMRRDFFTIWPGEDTRTCGDTWTQKKFYTLEVGNGLFKALVVSQIVFFTMYGVSLYASGVFSSTQVATFALIVLFSYITAMFFMAFFCQRFEETALSDAGASEEFGRSKVKAAIANRWMMMNIVWNTLTMYSCMEDAISKSEEKKKERVIFSQDEDDLK